MPRHRLLAALFFASLTAEAQPVAPTPTAHEPANAASTRASGPVAVVSSARATQLKRLSLEELLAMEVTTVSRRPEPFSKVASALSVLTGDDIRRSGALTLADALRYSTGLEVARIDGRTWGIASRGFNVNASNKLLVMMDGRSLYTPLFSGVFWDVQDTELADVDRIEVVRGPGATMWGANAVNGVINIQTKNARDTQGTLVTAGGGDEERHFASVRHGLRLGDGIFGRVYVKNFSRDDLVNAAGNDTKDDWKMTQGGFRIDGEAADQPDAWTLQGDLYHGFIHGSTASTRLAGGNLLGRMTHRFSPDQAWQTRVYYDRVERYLPGQFREERNTYDLDTEFTWQTGTRHRLVAGFAARLSDDRTGTDGTIRFSPTNRRMTVLSGFVQDDISFLQDRVGLTLGAKFEDNDSTGGEFQPSARFAWRPNDRHTVWAAVSRAVRTPTRFDDDLRFGVTPANLFVRGDRGFQSEELIAYEAGLRSHPMQGWSFDLSLFENRYDHLRSQEFAGEPGVLFVLRNRLNAHTRGGELGVQAQLAKPWRVRATYTRLDKKLRLDPGSTDPTRGAQEGNDPKHTFSLVSTWDLFRNWEFDAMLRRIGTLPNPLVPAYTELDLRLGWRPAPWWEFTVAGQNLLHRQHREFGAATPGVAELQRSVYFKVRWQY